MQLLAQEEYGLRCLLQVVAHGGSRPLTIPEIAEAEGLSTEYTGKLMRALRQGELVQSTRGPGGGYRLVRPATETTPWDAIQALGGGQPWSAGYGPAVRVSTGGPIAYLLPLCHTGQ